MKKNILVLVLFSAFIMNAQTIQQNTVDVTGEGIVRVIPNEVTVSVRIENTGTDHMETKKENDRVVSNVLSFLKTMQIEDKDVHTQYVRLNKNYDYNTKSYSYAANQSIVIILRDLLKYEELMSGLLSSGINRIDGISFSTTEREQLESEARIKAVADAKMKAEEYASVLDQSIGKAVSISEYRNSNVLPPMSKSMAFAGDASNGQQTIAPGEIEIQVLVYVSFLLK